MELFDHHRESQVAAEAPLAARMRPRTLDEFVGQQAIVGQGRLLRRAIQADQLSRLPSSIPAPKPSIASVFPKVAIR